ncbi:MAG TPA: kelch repeat-containing protein [Bacteroidia bacterium]|nr:kelch repeat-containing protein [Bacteroidia bacterium]
MKKIITAFVFCFLFGECFPQAGEWVWIKGDSIFNQPGNYGVQGVPSPTNNPPGLYESCEWKDLSGNFWLFGGNYGGNDVWKYNPATNEWTWMKGDSTQLTTGNYGVQGVPSPNNNPPPRLYAPARWSDTLGNLWTFGGWNGSSSSSFNDLWKYDVSANEWTWMKGPMGAGQPGNYGIQGVSSPSNNPPGRNECVAAWTDNSGDLWLFGGVESWFFEDLWRYNIASNQWTWMKGSQAGTNQTAVYGLQGVEDIANTPGPRWSYAHWKDSTGKLWLFSGLGGSLNPVANDLWRYNPSTNNWAWMSGYFTVPVFGNKCEALSTNIPWGRSENSTSWKDQQGNFWFFGGNPDLGANPGYANDLWKYCVDANLWIWISGDSTVNSIGSWGTQGVSNVTNKPNGRMGSVGWTDNNGHLYLFGGGVNVGLYFCNDLWKYTIDTTCGECPAPNSIQENNLPKADELLVFPNPANSSLTISFPSSEKQTVELRLYNTLGKQIYFSKEEIAKGKFEKDINVEKLSEGIYFLQLKTKEGLMNKKVIVQH